MLFSCGFIFLQTREAIRRFLRSEGSQVAIVKVLDGERIEQPGLTICNTHQPL